MISDFFVFVPFLFLGLPNFCIFVESRSQPSSKIKIVSKHNSENSSEQQQHLSLKQEIQHFISLYNQFINFEPINDGYKDYNSIFSIHYKMDQILNNQLTNLKNNLIKTNHYRQIQNVLCDIITEEVSPDFLVKIKAMLKAPSKGKEGTEGKDSKFVSFDFIDDIEISRELTENDEYYDKKANIWNSKVINMIEDLVSNNCKSNHNFLDLVDTNNLLTFLIGLSENEKASDLLERFLEAMDEDTYFLDLSEPSRASISKFDQELLNNLNVNLKATSKFRIRENNITKFQMQKRHERKFKLGELLMKNGKSINIQDSEKMKAFREAILKSNPRTLEKLQGLTEAEAQKSKETVTNFLIKELNSQPKFKKNIFQLFFQYLSVIEKEKQIKSGHNHNHLADSFLRSSSSASPFSINEKINLIQSANKQFRIVNQLIHQVFDMDQENKISNGVIKHMKEKLMNDKNSKRQIFGKVYEKVNVMVRKRIECLNSHFGLIGSLFGDFACNNL